MLAEKIHFYYKVLDYLARGNIVSPSEIREDYDRVSRNYDRCFSDYVGRHSRDMVRALDLHEGARVLDLASGTGTLSFAAARAVGRGQVTGVDQSSGMIAVAGAKQKKLGLENVSFIEGDIRDVLNNFPERSFDAITCGWAIAYVDPLELLCLMKSRLKENGKIGLIENRRNTLLPVRRTCTRVAQHFSYHLNKVMDLHFRLPKGKWHLKRLIRKAGLDVKQVWDGKEEFSFCSGAEALDWVLHTGASAGFDRMMSADIKAECDARFVEFIERDYLRNGRIRLAHRYVAGIAVK
jgi:ubiquinone/menaquinone biosynthesis C-methylase UbiE